jgi:hypothetical protein
MPPAAPSRWPVIDLVELTDLARVVAEDLLDGERLELVVVGRRGAVGVDVVDLVGRTPAASARLMASERPLPSGSGCVM